MNLLDSIDKSTYTLLFSEETEVSPYPSKVGTGLRPRNLPVDGNIPVKPNVTQATRPHTLLNMKTTLVNGSYGNCDNNDSSSDVELDEKKPLVQSEVKHGLSPVKSCSRNGLAPGPNLPQPPSRNDINSKSSGVLTKSYNIDFVSSSRHGPTPKGSVIPHDIPKEHVVNVESHPTTEGHMNGHLAAKNNWGPDSYSSNLSTGAGATVNSYSEGQKILPSTYFIKDYSEIFGNIGNYETDDVAKLPITSEESKMFLIGLSSNNENEDEDDTMENEDQGSSNSPFQSATEEMGGDGDHDRDQDPLLIRPPPKQNVFHQFIRSAKSSKNRMKQSRKHTLKDDSSPEDGSSNSALIKPVESPDSLDDGGDAMLPGSSDDLRAGVSGGGGGSKCSIGILLAAISCFFFATSALIVKISNLHPMELLAVRGTIQGILVSPIVISTGNSFVGPSGSRSLLLARAVLGAVALVMGFASIHLIPLADAATVIFTSPVFVSIFACLCLGEVCCWFDVSMIALTLVGVLLVSKPSFSFISTGTWTGIVGTICGLIAAMLTALAFIVLRQLKQVHYSVTVFWFSSVLAMFGAVLTVALDGFTLPRSLSSIGECIGIGFCGFMGQILLTKALQSENALPIAVTRTFDIVLAFFYQITLLHDTPDWYSYLGSVLVVSCVLLTAFRRWYKESTKNKYTRVHKVTEDDEPIMDDNDNQHESSSSPPRSRPHNHQGRGGQFLLNFQK